MNSHFQCDLVYKVSGSFIIINYLYLCCKQWIV